MFYTSHSHERGYMEGHHVFPIFPMRTLCRICLSLTFSAILCTRIGPSKSNNTILCTLIGPSKSNTSVVVLKITTQGLPETVCLVRGTLSDALTAVRSARIFNDYPMAEHADSTDASVQHRAKTTIMAQACVNCQ